MRVTCKTDSFRCAGEFAFAPVLQPRVSAPTLLSPKLLHTSAWGRSISKAGFTIIEVLAGTVVTAIMLLSLYAGFTFGFQQIQLARQNERATQILEEKMELVRLLNWNQITNPGYVPITFQEAYNASSPTNAASGSYVYSGTVVVTNAPVTETYSNDLRMVEVQVSWVDGGKTHTRQMTTFDCQYGMQNYIY